MPRLKGFRQNLGFWLVHLLITIVGVCIGACIAAVIMDTVSGLLHQMGLF